MYLISAHSCPKRSAENVLKLSTIIIVNTKRAVYKRKEEKEMNNIIKRKLKEKRMKQWELADCMQISENTLCRKLRYELPKEEQERICKIIDDYMKEKQK